MEQAKELLKNLDLSDEDIAKFEKGEINTAEVQTRILASVSKRLESTPEFTKPFEEKGRMQAKAEFTKKTAKVLGVETADNDTFETVLEKGVGVYKEEVTNLRNTLASTKPEVAQLEENFRKTTEAKNREIEELRGLVSQTKAVFDREKSELVSQVEFAKKESRVNEAIATILPKVAIDGAVAKKFLKDTFLATHTINDKDEIVSLTDNARLYVDGLLNKFHTPESFVEHIAEQYNMLKKSNADAPKNTTNPLRGNVSNPTNETVAKERLRFS